MNIITCIVLILLFITGREEPTVANEFGARQAYELDANAFDDATLNLIRDRTGLALPPDIKGLNFHYYPPIDPGFAAKLEVSPASRQAVIDMLSTVPNNAPHFASSYGSELDWWDADRTAVVLGRRTNSGMGEFLKLILTEKDDRVLLYIGYGIK